jgi:hypothetical protein
MHTLDVAEEVFWLFLSAFIWFLLGDGKDHFFYEFPICFSQRQNINPHKATGPDEICCRVLKELSATIFRPLTLIFQKTLET